MSIVIIYIHSNIFKIKGWVTPKNKSSIKISPKFKKNLTPDCSLYRVWFWRYGVLNIFVMSLGKLKNACKRETVSYKDTRISGCIQ